MAESATTAQHHRPAHAAAPGEGQQQPAEQHHRPAIRRAVTTPSTPARGGTTHQLHVALTWADRGQPVVPCSQRKRPLVGGFAVGDDLALFTDRQQLTTWWTTDYAGAHVGLLTYRLLVVDLDVSKSAPLTGRWAGCQDGADVLARRIEEFGGWEWPETYTVVTPSGGVHLYFLQPEQPIGCRTGTGRKGTGATGDPAPGHVGPMVDVRGAGGFVIAAGSTGHAGTYERISPPSVAPTPVPPPLAALLHQPPVTPPAAPPRLPVQYSTRAARYATAALTGAARDVAEAPAGEGNRMLFARARRLGEISGLTPDVLTLTTVQDHLIPAAVGRGRTTEAEARRTVESGWNAGLRGAGAAA